MNIKKEFCYIKDNQVAILISPKHTGSWSHDFARDLAYDRGLIEKWLEFKKEIITKKEIENFIMESFEEKVDMDDYKDLEIQWVNIGEYFYIDEYDGAEGIISQDEMLKVE